MMIRKIFLPTLAAALLSGCFTRSENARHYLLSVPAPESSTPVMTQKTFIVGLRLAAAEFLRTRRMIVQTDANEVRLSDDNVWEETPQAGFARVLSQRFAKELPECQLSTLPVATTNAPGYILDIQLTAMQGKLKPQAEALVSAEVRIFDATGRLLERDELSKTVPWSPTMTPNNYPALAAAESRAVNDLVEEIGEKLLALRRKIPN